MVVFSNFSDEVENSRARTPQKKRTKKIAVNKNVLRSHWKLVSLVCGTDHRSSSTDSIHNPRQPFRVRYHLLENYNTSSNHHVSSCHQTTDYPSHWSTYIFPQPCLGTGSSPNRQGGWSLENNLQFARSSRNQPFPSVDENRSNHRANIRAGRTFEKGRGGRDENHEVEFFPRHYRRSGTAIEKSCVESGKIDIVWRE